MIFRQQKWLWLLMVLLLATACGGSAETDTAAPDGPALIMLYTDN